MGDLENIGDVFDVEVVFYCFDNDICIGNFELVSWFVFNDNWDVYMWVSCLELDIWYYILVDGVFIDFGDEEGVFGLCLISIDVDDVFNEWCDVFYLGVVLFGDIISMNIFYGNYCVDSNNDFFSLNFVV